MAKLRPDRELISDPVMSAYNSHDMASTLRELAAAAEALADTLERERDGS